MLWILTIFLLLFGLASLTTNPLLGAGIFVVCTIIYDKKLRGTSFRLFPRRQRVAKQYRQPKPQKLSRRERKRLEQQDNLSYQIQQKNNEIARLKERIAELEKKIREQNWRLQFYSTSFP